MIEPEASTEARSAFFIRRAVNGKLFRMWGGRSSRGYFRDGSAATIMVCGVEWTSTIPRTEAECAQVNAWGEKIIKQNILKETKQSI